MSSANQLLRRLCPECDEECHGQEKCCFICGAGIIEEELELPNQENSLERSAMFAGQEGDLAAYLDLFGIDFQDLLERFHNSESNTVISQDYVSTLGKVDVDERYSILKNFAIHIGPLKVNSVPALFSQLDFTNGHLEAPLVIADPVHCESPLKNPAQYKGSILVTQRGAVSFVSKVNRALEVGAVAVIVTQTGPKWPFVMADSTGEVKEGVANIPVSMVSETDGELLMKWIRSKMSDHDGSLKTKVVLSFHDLPRECSICQDDMKQGENVLRLSCCHIFHSECIMAWLSKNNSCPLCRFEMPSTVSTGSSSDSRRSEEISHRQNYFS